MQYNEAICSGCQHFTKKRWPHDGFRWYIKNAYGLEKSPRYIRSYTIYICKYNDSRHMFAFDHPKKGFNNYYFNLSEPQHCERYLEYLIVEGKSQ